MAALKKNGEEDWKKRNNNVASNSTTAPTLDNSDDHPPSRVNIVKQQKELLQHQLQLAVPKYGGQPSKLAPVEMRRPAAGQSNDNLDENNGKISNKYSFSNESLENLESNSNAQIQRNKFVPLGHRVVLSPSDLNANTGIDF